MFMLPVIFPLQTVATQRPRWNESSIFTTVYKYIFRYILISSYFLKSLFHLGHLFHLVYKPSNFKAFRE